MNVAVDDRLRRQGIASTLLERLFELADRPNEQYTLEVRTSNDGAITLYERFGFRAAGRRRAYYHDNREDALIMWRTVTERATAECRTPSTQRRGLILARRDRAATTPAPRSSPTAARSAPT